MPNRRGARDHPPGRIREKARQEQDQYAPSMTGPFSNPTVGGAGETDRLGS